MKFGPIPAADAAGTILAHSLKLGKRVLKKGRVLLPEDVTAILAEGVTSLVAARLDPDDVGEDAAADQIARAALGRGASAGRAFTGRVNLFADTRGVLVIDRERLDRLNLIDESVTFGTLPPFSVVEPKQMLATVKIIPFAAPAAAVARCAAIATEGGPLLSVAAFAPRDAGLIQTILPGLKSSVLDKTRDVTEARLAALESRLAFEERCAHRSEALSPLIHDAARRGIEILLIAGASAIVDRRDVIPAAIIEAGGTVEHFGMPVDPGNLLLLGRLGKLTILGLPGCARSPKVNGFDWVLERLVAGISIGRENIMRMGAGGLLAEIPSRPLPRAKAGPLPGPLEAEEENMREQPSGAVAPEPARQPHQLRIAALILAAGRSSRMGGPNKLLAAIDGKPMVRHVAEALLASQAEPVLAVLGNQASTVGAALEGLPIARIENPDFASGLSTSLKRGIAALPADIDGVLVCLGDMPLVSTTTIDRLIAAFNPLEGRGICVPTCRGKRGNPVLWAKRFLSDMAELAGDVGAKHLIGEHADLVVEVEMPDDGVLLDIDTPEALAEFRALRAVPVA